MRQAGSDQHAFQKLFIARCGPSSPFQPTRFLPRYPTQATTDPFKSLINSSKQGLSGRRPEAGPQWLLLQAGIPLNYHMHIKVSSKGSRERRMLLSKAVLITCISDPQTFGGGGAD